jgi:hypothetical protein
MTMLAVPAVLMSAPKMNQDATNKPDNDTERKSRTKVKRRASGDHLRVLKWIGDLEKDQDAERRK